MRTHILPIVVWGLYMCPHTSIYLSDILLYPTIDYILLYVSWYYYTCVLNSSTVASRYGARALLMCPHTTIYESSYYYICVLILLYMCPHTTTCVLTSSIVASPIRCSSDSCLMPTYEDSMRTHIQYSNMRTYVAVWRHIYSIVVCGHM
jgi:hypothetical protein